MVLRIMLFLSFLSSLLWFSGFAHLLQYLLNFFILSIMLHVHPHLFLGPHTMHSSPPHSHCTKLR